MILIKEVSKDNMPKYWNLHWEYLNRDIFPHESLCDKSNDEDREYFKSKAYGGVLESYMDRTPDKAHFIYFYKNNLHIGCSQYVTYKSEDGKCFILDFWVFPEYRGNSLGHECYYALKNYVKEDGGKYFAINISNHRNHNFWSSIGFDDNGFDEWNSPLMKINI